MALRITTATRVLKGLGGAAIALPALEVMFDRHGEAYAQGRRIPKRYLVVLRRPVARRRRRSAAQRLRARTPSAPNYDLKSALAPLAARAVEISVVSGLQHPDGERRRRARRRAARRLPRLVAVAAARRACARPPTRRRPGRRRTRSSPPPSPATRRSSRSSTACRSLVPRRLGAVRPRHHLVQGGRRRAASRSPSPPVVSPHDGVRRALHELHAARRSTAADAAATSLLRQRKSVLDLVDGKLRSARRSRSSARPTRCACSTTSTRSATSRSADRGDPARRGRRVPEARRPRRRLRRSGGNQGVDAAARTPTTRTSATATRSTRARVFCDLIHMALRVRSDARRLAAVHDVPVAHEHVRADRRSTATSTSSATTATRSAAARWPSAR